MIQPDAQCSGSEGFRHATRRESLPNQLGVVWLNDLGQAEVWTYFSRGAFQFDERAQQQ